MHDVRRTEEKFVDHSALVCDLQTFIMFSQHPTWVYNACKLMGSADVIVCVISEIT